MKSMTHNSFLSQAIRVEFFRSPENFEDLFQFFDISRFLNVARLEFLQWKIEHLCGVSTTGQKQISIHSVVLALKLQNKANEYNKFWFIKHYGYYI